LSPNANTPPTIQSSMNGDHPLGTTSSNSSLHRMRRGRSSSGTKVWRIDRMVVNGPRRSISQVLREQRTQGQFRQIGVGELAIAPWVQNEQIHRQSVRGVLRVLPDMCAE